MLAKMTVIRRLALLVMLLFGAVLLRAQEAGTISGTVTDPSGALVPNAKISVIQEATAATVRVVKTNGAGFYSVPDLSIGSYSVHAEAPGFRILERDHIVLDVNSSVKADMSLALGPETENVVVEANPLQIQTQTSELSTLINGSQIDEIDTNGRSIFQLVELVPGASSGLPPFNNPVSNNTTDTVSFNGLSSSHNLYLLDGAAVNDRGCGGCYDITPSQNAISEFKVISSNAQADVGFASGGLVALATKSGGRDFHGQAWEYVRNDAFDADDYFLKQSGTPNAELRYNIFGFNLSGPVVIPHLYGSKRNKTFFFYNMEWRRLIQGQPSDTIGIPAAQFSGNFGSNAITVPFTNDPVSLARFASYGLAPGQAFPNNQIPAGLIDKNVALLLKAGIFPAANSSGGDYISAPPQPSDIQEEIGRIDHQFNDKLTLHLTLLYDGGTYANIPPGYGATYPTDGSFTANPSYAVVVRLTHAISPSLVNEPGFDFNGNQIKVTPTGLYQLPAGYTASSFYTGVNTDNRIPDIDLGSPYGVSYTVGSNPWYNQLAIFQPKDDISWTHGRHNFRAGGALMLLHKYQAFFGSTQGTYGFSGTFTGNSFADLLLGFAASYSQLADQAYSDTAAHSLAFYALDNWRVNNRLTLNVGLRWEYLPHTFDKENHLANFVGSAYNPAKAAVFNPDGSLNPLGPGFQTVGGTPYYLNGIVIAGQNGTPVGLANTEYHDFGPRLGFAYQLDPQGKMVLRGGFGILYDRVQGGDTYGLGPNPPFSNTPSANNVYFSNPATSNSTGTTASTPIFPSSLTAINPNYPVPASMQYSLGIQRQMSPVAVFSVAYAGTHSYHQEDFVDINTVPLDDPNRLAICGGTCGYNGAGYNTNLDRNYPGWSDIGNQTNVGKAWYNSLQLAFNMTVKRNLNLSASYTYSHEMDYGGNFDDPFDMNYDRGNGGLDRRHIAKFSYFYDIPLFKNSHNLLARNTLGGWRISGITTFQTGTPNSINYGSDNTGLGGYENSRVDQIAPVKYIKSPAAWVDYNSFAAPAPLVFGNSRRNLVYGPGLENFDMSLFKNFQLSPGDRGVNLEFRAEAYNVFNHTQFTGFNTNWGNGLGQFGQLNSDYEPRTLQFGASLKF